MGFLCLALMTEYQPEFPRIKLHRPHAIAGWIERPRLLKQLDQVLQRPVALISAPAGFGKTTLISQWLDRCPLPSAWLQLDEGDHDIPTFLAGVVAAMRQLFPGCMQKTADLIRPSGSVPLSVWKSALMDDLELLDDRPFILALDDYHLVANPSIDLLLADVLRFDPQPMHLILSARRSPSLSFSRLRLDGLVVDIRSADLRFTDAESSLYILQTSHLQLSVSAINLLQVKTEGWPVGLTLAAISLREEAQPDELIAHLDGSDSRVSDYLLDQVFNSQPAEIQEFLLKTATFDQFCASMLADAIETGQSEAEIQALLERIESAQLFLTPLDNQRTFYRYHHLFRQMLLSRQRFHLNAAQIAQFHRRASVWLVNHGETDQALSHLLAVHDWTGAAQLVESQLCLLLNVEDFQGIKRRLDHFSEDFIATRPGLLLMQAWTAHFALRLPLLQSLTARIQAILDAAAQADGGPDGDTPVPGFEAISRGIAQAQVWMLDSVRYYLTNRGDLAMPLARQAVQALPETWRFARGNAMVYLGLSMLMEGQYSQTVRDLQQEYERLHDPSSTYGARLLFCLSVIYLLNGELELCRQTAEHMLRDSLLYNLKLMQGWGYYLLGRVYHEWNQLERAAGYYQQAVEQRFTSNLMPSLESIAGFVSTLHFLGRGEQAQQFLNSLEQFHNEQTPVMPPQVMSLLAWLNLKNGDREAARRWAEAFTFPISELAIVWYHIPHIYKIRILMETGEMENCCEVDQLLDEIQASAECTHNTFTLIRVLAMRAVWLGRQGEGLAAQQVLERAIRLGRPGWFVHTFAEQGPEMLELLQVVSQSLKNEAAMYEYIAALIGSFSPSIEPSSGFQAQKQVKTLLTERELDVLELLAGRLSINEISTRLFISPSTVQQHTHHIYRKLNVANKRQAVARAIELGILPPDR